MILLRVFAGMLVAVSAFAQQQQTEVGDPWRGGEILAITGDVPSSKEYQDILLQSKELKKAIDADARIKDPAVLKLFKATKFTANEQRDGTAKLELVFDLSGSDDLSEEKAQLCTIRVSARIERSYFYSDGEKIWLTEIFRPTVRACSQ